MVQEEVKKLTRRSFLKTSGAVAGLAAFTAWGCAPQAPQEAAESQPEGGEALPATGPDEKVVISRCGFGGCTACEREVIVREGKVVGTRPSATEAFGRRPCLRAYSTVNRLYAEDRIKYPMKRASWSPDDPKPELRGKDEWERISWDEAIQLICDKWKSIREEYGSRAVVNTGSGGMGLSGMGAASRLTSALETTSVDGSIDMGVKVGLQRVCGKNSNISNKPGHDPWEEDVYVAKTVVAWSSNFSSTYTQRFRHILGAQAKGTRIISVDPRQTIMSDRADNWYRVRPATDTALVNACCQVIIEEGLIDEQFMKEQSAASGLVRRDTGAYLRMSDLGVEPTEGPADMMGNPTLIDPYAVWDNAAGAPVALGEAADPLLDGSPEVNGIACDTAFTLLKNHLNENYTPEKVTDICDVSPDDIRELARFCADGPVLHIDGLGWQQYDNGAATGQALMTLMTITGNLIKPGAGLTPANGAFMEFGVMDFSYLNATGTTSLSVPVMMLPEIAKTRSYNGEELPPFKMMLHWGYNFQGGTVDMNSTMAMMDDIDLVVGINLTMVDTCAFADIVLPAAHVYEKEDVMLVALERIVPHYDKAIDPLYEAKTDFDIAKLLADGMGLGEHFQFTQEGFLRGMLGGDVLKERNVTLDTLRENHSLRWHDPGFMWEDSGWLTPSKKLELYCENPQPRMNFGQEFDQSNAKLPTWVPPAEAYPTTEPAKKYPMILNTFRTNYYWGFQGHESAWFHELEPDVVAYVNETDAKERGINEGDWLEIYNDRGHAVAKARYDASVRPGMVYVPKGYASDEYKAGNTAEMIGAYVDPLCVNQSFYDVAVEMRPWTEE